MKPTENVWDAIAADLAAVTAATDGPDETVSEDVGEETDTVRETGNLHDSDSLHADLGIEKTLDGSSLLRKEIEGDGRSGSARNSSGTDFVGGAQNGPKGGDVINLETVVCKDEVIEVGEESNPAPMVVETPTESTDEDVSKIISGPGEGEGREDSGDHILGKRNRNSDQRVIRSSGKKLKVQLPAISSGAETAHKDIPDNTIPSGESWLRAEDIRHKIGWVESQGANIHVPPGLQKFHRVFTSLNTACGFLLKQQLNASWQNVKQAMQQLSGADGEVFNIEDVRRLANMCPRIVLLSQFSGEGEDATFNVELLDPADPAKGAPHGSSEGNTTTDAGVHETSAVKQVSDLEARLIVERRQKAFQMSLAQIAHQFQPLPSGSPSANGDDHARHPAMRPHPGMVRHREGQQNMAILALPTQKLVHTPPPTLPQHGFMNMHGGYAGIAFPMQVPPSNVFGPYGSYPQPQGNNYAGYQLSSLPSTSQSSPMPPHSNIPERGLPTTTPPLVVDVPEVSAAPELSSYHGLSMNKAKRRRSRNWDTWEVLLLVQAKKSEWERSESSSGRGRFETSGERWKKVERHLKDNKVVDRDAGACKNKWEAILSDYKAIKDWNRKPGNITYSLLSPAEKKAASLPAVFASSVVELMDTFQGKSSHVPHPSVVDCLVGNNTAVSGGATSGGDGSGAEDSGEAHPNSHGGNGLHGSAGGPERTDANTGSPPLVAAFDRLSANMLNIERGRDERSERLWALETKKYDLEKSKFELQARKLDAEREDRKGLVRVLGNLAGAFHRMADKM